MKRLLVLLLLLQSTLAFTQEILLQSRQRDLGLKAGIDAPEGISVSPAGVIYTTSMKTGKIYAAQEPNYVPKEILKLSKLKGWQKGTNPKALGKSNCGSPYLMCGGDASIRFSKGKVDIWLNRHFVMQAM